MSAPHRVEVRAGGASRDYPVLVGRGSLAGLPNLLLEHAGAHRVAVISDETVASLHAPGVLRDLAAAGIDASLFRFPPGERHKNRETWAALTDALLGSGLGRDAAVVALGGGVTGDLAGFVAATFLRGVPLIQVPTSLVAMIDASVGGKTGVDTPAGKNLVGAFHPPALVLVDPDLLATLPRPERAQGLVEALKHGLVLDAGYLARLESDLESLLSGSPSASLDAVLRSIEIKARVVSEDEREAGFREILNFGHTVGHALEAASDYRLSHGTAVALGMILEARLGERLGISEPGCAERIAETVARLRLPEAEPSLDAGRIVSYLATDKKRRSGQVRFVLLKRPGEVAYRQAWSVPVEASEVRALLREAEWFPFHK